MSDKKKSERHVVKWRSPSGRQYQILIPAKSRVETPEDFESRVRWAQAKASEHEVAGDFISSLSEKYKGLSRVELVNAGMIDLMDKIDRQQQYTQTLKAMEPGQFSKNLLDKASLDMMRLTAQKKALQSFIATNPYTVEFAGEEGEGLSLYLDEKGMPQAAVDTAEEASETL